MKKKLQISLVVTIVTFLLGVNNLFSQSFKADDYKKAAWMTARFYGAQRSGNGPNWLLAEHLPTNVPTALSGNLSAHQQGKSFIKDADNTTGGVKYDLTGGWVDCGDHVKFGQTEFYSAYMLILGYSEFPQGYNDYYSADYKGYITNKDYTWESAKDSPNGIPDILDELKYATDFFQKCVRSTTQFYYQVGDGDADHKHWVTAPIMSTLAISEGGEKEGSRSVKMATGSVTSMASLCGATLASMARLYKKFDPAYAQSCLNKALTCYTFVTTTTKGNTGGGGYYPAKGKYEPDMVIFFTELYRTTGETKYLTAAVSAANFMNSSSDWNHNFSLCYNNTEDLAYYLLAKCGDATSKKTALDHLTYYVDKLYKPASGYFLNVKNDSWGVLRYPANQAFVCALLDKLNGVKTINPYTAGSVDYIMGKNGKSFSYIVGFGSKYPHFPHHRNFYGSDGDSEGNLAMQTKYAQFGYMVGGSLNDGAYTDDEKTYTYSEGGIDYNAGLVGAISYMVSMMAPVDTNKFGHPTPQLGANQSMCGVTSILLDSKVATDGKKTFTWKKDGTTVVTASTTAKTYTATAAGVYLCQIDSTGWSTTSTVTITATLPDFSIGNDTVLCSLTSDTLKAATGTGFSYAWKKNGTVINGATSFTYIAYTAGTYICTISASGCTSKSDTATIISSLPIVVNDTICKVGTANLSVSTAGSYAWYSTATGGTAITTGISYSANITANTVFYVQDASSFTGSVGPSTRMSTGSDWGVSAGNQLKFTVGNTFTLNSLKLNYATIYNDDAASTITIEILDANGASFSPAKTFTSNTSNVTTAMSNTLVKYTFSNLVIDKSWGTNLRMRLSAKSTNGGVVFNTAGAVYPYNSNPSGIVTITGTAGGSGGTSDYMYFYDWNVSSGSTCSRAPVQAILDPNSTKCNQTCVTPTANAGTDVSICLGKSTTLTATGGGTYTWSNGATTASTTVSPTVSTTYTVTVTSATGSCSATDNVLVTVNALPTISAGASATICSGTSTNLTATGGSTYSWSTGSTTAAITVTPTSTTLYTLTGTTASGCSATSSATVSVVSTPNAPTVTTPVTYLLNATATALSATGTALKWYTVSTAGSALATAPIPTTTASGSSSYYVSQTVNTCESPRATIVVNVTANATQNISLVSGWNLISFNVQPTDSNITAVFGSLGTSLLTVKTQDAFYDPNQSAIYNSLTKIEKGKAYLVKVNAAKTVTVSGNLISTISIPLNAGWNLVGYPKTANGAIATVLTGIWTPFSFIKNFDGFYQKSGTTNSLTNMIPGSGYFIKVSSSCTLNY